MSQKAPTLEQLIEKYAQEIEDDSEYDEFIAQRLLWFNSLPKEKHRDKTWIRTHPQRDMVYEWYEMGARDAGKQSQLIEPYEIPAVAVALNSLSATKEQLEVILRYAPERRLLYLEGPILNTFSAFVKQGIEHGGMIDLNKAGIFDRAIFGIGNSKNVSVDDLADYEVIFHTHPVGRPDRYEAPSEGDVKVSMLSGNQQVHIVFTPEGIYTIYAPKAAYDYRVNQAISNIHWLFMNMSNYEEVMNYLREFSKYGIYIFRYSKIENLEKVINDEESLDPEPIHNWPERIPLFIDPQEPNISLKMRNVRANQVEAELAKTMLTQQRERERRQRQQRQQGQQKQKP